MRIGGGLRSASMNSRTELLEAALDSLAEGLAVADCEGHVTLWNEAAVAITGYPGSEMIGHQVREMLDQMVVGGSQHWIRRTEAALSTARGCVVRIRHKLANELTVVARVLELRDALGERIGSGVIFHPAECLDALPRGELSEGSSVGESRAELEDRLMTIHADFLRSGVPLGVLWIAVDQASRLRRSHGSRAVEAMLEKVERTLATGLKPTEEIGRWGDDEFLVLSHERNAAMLGAHGQLLVGVARTTDFRWWGDRVSLTVSVGAAQAQPGESLNELLSHAQAAMLSSVDSGGNHLTASRENTCLQS